MIRYPFAKELVMKQVIFCACLMMFAACSSNEKNEQALRSPIPVRVGKVRHIADRETVLFSGTITSPEAPSNLSFLVSGKVIQVVPREGDYVRKGDVLASVDPIDYRLALKAASAQADMARAALDKAKNPIRPELLEQARIAYERAGDEHRRMKMLYDAKSLAPNDYQKVKAAYESAEQQYEQAKRGGQKEDRSQAAAALDLALANEAIARKHLSDTTLYSPMDGFISGRYISPGELAAPARPVFEIVRLDPAEVSVGVPETDVHIVRVGQKAVVTIPALPEESFEGVVRLINVSADPASRTFMTRISVANPKHVLRIGMVAEARIYGDKPVRRLTLPVEAVVREPQGATIVFVYFPDQKQVYAKRVEVGTIFGDEIEIRQGLDGKELIVSGGQERLRDGVAVTATMSVEPGKEMPQ